MGNKKMEIFFATKLHDQFTSRSNIKTQIYYSYFFPQRKIRLQ